MKKHLIELHQRVLFDAFDEARDLIKQENILKIIEAHKDFDSDFKKECRERYEGEVERTPIAAMSEIFEGWAQDLRER